MKTTALKWLKEMGFISEEEFDNTMKHIMERKKHKASGDPDPGAVEAAAPAEVAAAPARPKLDKEAIEMIRASFLPNVNGCLIIHDERLNYWQARYPNCSPTIRCRAYERHKNYSSIQCLNHVLNWVWEHHTAQTGEACPWDFTPRCP